MSSEWAREGSAHRGHGLLVGELLLVDDLVGPLLGERDDVALEDG